MNESTAEAAEINPYQPPQAALADSDVAAQPVLFYVVAPWKFVLLMLGTLNFYAFYWFYRNWSGLNRRDHAYWAVPRAIFTVFFTHALFGEVEAELRRKGHGKYFWSANRWAGLYVVSAVANYIVDRDPQNLIPATAAILLSLAFMAPKTYALYRAQLAINIAADDPQGRQNARLGIANTLWLVLGGSLWFLVVLGFLAETFHWRFAPR